MQIHRISEEVLRQIWTITTSLAILGVPDGQTATPAAKAEARRKEEILPPRRQRCDPPPRFIHRLGNVRTRV